MKNRFEKGDQLLLITPEGNFNYKLEQLESLGGESITSAPGSGHVVRIPTPEQMASKEQVEYALLMRFID